MEVHTEGVRILPARNEIARVSLDAITDHWRHPYLEL